MLANIKTQLTEITNLLIRSLSGLILGIIGMSMIVYWANWQTAVGVFVFTWANNLKDL